MKNEKLKKIQDIGTTIFLFVGYSLCISVLIVMLIFECRQVIYTNYDNEPTTAEKCPLRANESNYSDRLYNVSSEKLNDAISNNHFISDNDYFEGVNDVLNYRTYNYKGEITFYLNESSENYNKSGDYSYIGTRYYMPANSDIWKLSDIYLYNDYYAYSDYVYLVKDYTIICDEIGTSTIRLKNAVFYEPIAMSGVDEAYNMSSIATFSTHYLNYGALNYTYNYSIGSGDNQYNFLGLILGSYNIDGYYLQQHSSPVLEWGNYYRLPSSVMYNDNLYNYLYLDWTYTNFNDSVRFVLPSGDIVATNSDYDIYYISEVYLAFCTPQRDSVGNLESCYYSTPLFRTKIAQYTYADGNNNSHLGTSYYINNYQRLTYGDLYVYDETALISHQNYWRNIAINQDIIPVSSGGVISNIFVLIKDAFSSLLPFLNISIVPGITIGLLCFLPLVATIIVLVIRVLRK